MGGPRAGADVAACVYCVSGVYVFFILFGIAQERINTREYGAARERMVYTLALIFMQCTTNVTLAAVALRLSPAEHKRSYRSPWTLAVGKMATSYIGAMFCSNLALQYINYPTQVLVKSCKMVPVMAANMLMGIHHYSHAAKLRVLLLTTGICAFLLAKPAEPEHAAHHDGSEAERLKATGLALALASLACDGYTGGAQDRLVHAVRPTSHQLMLWTNLWAMGLLAAALALSGQGVLAVRFAARHPEMITDLALFCGTSALGQNFIYFSIARFGALPTAVITTTRKFFTILASVLWFGHPVSATQWLSILLVFAALGSELYQKLIASKNHGRFHGGGAHAPLAPNERRPGERRGSDASSVEMGQLTDGDNGDATIGMLSAPPSDMEDDDDDEAADSARANGLLNGPALEMARTPYETVRLLGLMKQRSSSSARLPELAGPRLFEKEQRPQMREV